jgi:Spy/CpxP family protein refolding chaperone
MLLTVALSGALTLGMTVAAMAQDTTSQPQTPNPSQMQGRHGRGQMGPEQQLARLTQVLGLTSDQQKQILPLLQGQQQLLQALVQDASVSVDNRPAQAKAIREDTHEKIEGLLTNEQRQKFEALMANMNRGGEGGQPSGSSHPQV